MDKFRPTKQESIAIEQAKQTARESVKKYLEEARDRTYGVTIRICPHCGKEI